MKNKNRARFILSGGFFLILCAALLFSKAGPLAYGASDILSVKVTLNYRDADLIDVLRSISEESKINIIAGPKVAGKVTARLENVALKEALDSILTANGYTYIKEGDILVVVSASEAQDSGGAAGEQITVRVFELKCISAEDVKAAIGKLLTKNGTMEVFNRSKEAGDKGRSNFLIVSDIPSVLGCITEIIKKIDVRPKQVIIEIRIEDISVDVANRLGLKWNVSTTLVGSKVPVTFPIDSKGKWIPEEMRTAGSLPTAVAGGDSSTTSSVSSDFTTGYFFPNVISDNFIFGKMDFTNLSMTLDLIESQGKAKVIASPKIAALDSEEAQITVGQNIPIPLYQLNQDTGAMVVTGYQDQKVGIDLKVTPHIMENGYISMRLLPRVSALTGKYVGPNNERPITRTREAQTVITVKDGETIAIGGLINEEETVIETKVPFLNKIPFLGGAFKHKETVTSKNNMVIFVTPHLVKDDETVPALAQKDDLNQDKKGVSVEIAAADDTLEKAKAAETAKADKAQAETERVKAQALKATEETHKAKAEVDKAWAEAATAMAEAATAKAEADAAKAEADAAKAEADAAKAAAAKAKKRGALSRVLDSTELTKQNSEER